MKIRIITFFIFLLFSNFLIFAGGNFKSVNSAKALSLDGLYVAGQNGVSGIYNNPAGLISLNGAGVDLTIQDRISTYKFDNTLNGLYQSYGEDDFNISGGFFWKILENFVVGASYNNAINFNVDWPFTMFRQSDSASAVLGFEFANQIKAEAISPAAAFKMGNYTVGLSINLYRVTWHTAFPLENKRWFQNIGDAAYQFNYDLDAWSVGFSLGFLADFSSSLSVGASVKSGFKSSLKGNAKSQMFAVLDSASFQTNISGNLEMPWTFSLGIIYTLSDNLKLNLDGAYSLWGQTPDRFKFSFDDSFWQSRLTQTDSISGINPSSFPLLFKNSFDMGIGLEYKPVGDFTYRIGYCFSKSPNSEITYNMFFPNIDRHSFSIGIGYAEEGWSVDGALLFSIGISKSVISSLPVLTGEYNYNLVMPTITLKYKL